MILCMINSIMNPSQASWKECTIRLAGVIQGTLCECLNKELGLKSLSDRKWVCNLTLVYKIAKVNSLQYLSDDLKGNNNSVYDVEMRTK